MIKGTKKWGKNEKEKKEKTDKSRSKQIKKEKYNQQIGWANQTLQLTSYKWDKDVI
jgi:hypothetical protein